MEKNAIKETISFSQLNEQQVRRMFGLKQELKKNLLANWEKRITKVVIDTDEDKILKRLYKKLQTFIRSWNEEELKLKFIGNLIELVDFDNVELEFVAFSERPLSYQFKNIEIKGIVDLVVASGITQPEQPFFFIHVPIAIGNKREQDSSGDPVGQLLSAMLVAQELNKKPKPYTLFNIQPNTYPNLPIYGVYVIGRIWVFVVLVKEQYYLSKSYDSTNFEHLQYIFKMLKAQKEMIYEVMEASSLKKDNP